MNNDVRFRCPKCGKMLRAPATLAGKRARCACGERVIVPDPEQQTPREDEPLTLEPVRPGTRSSRGRRRGLVGLVMGAAACLALLVGVVVLAWPRAPRIAANNSDGPENAPTPQPPAKTPREPDTKQSPPEKTITPEPMIPAGEPKDSDSSWKTWTTEKGFVAAAVAHPLTADFYPLKPGTEFRPLETYYEKGKVTQLTFKILNHTNDGILSKTDKIIKDPDPSRNYLGLILPGNVIPEFLLKHGVKDGYLAIGRPLKKSDDGSGAGVRWIQEIKLGAKIGDRWYAAPGPKSDEKEYREYLAAGTFNGARCAVIGRVGSFTVFAEGIGPVLQRTYEHDGATWNLAYKTDWTAPVPPKKEPVVEVPKPPAKAANSVWKAETTNDGRSVLSDGQISVTFPPETKVETSGRYASANIAQKTGEKLDGYVTLERRDAPNDAKKTDDPQKWLKSDVDQRLADDRKSEDKGKLIYTDVRLDTTKGLTLRQYKGLKSLTNHVKPGLGSIQVEGGYHRVAESDHYLIGDFIYVLQVVGTGTPNRNAAVLFGDHTGFHRSGLAQDYLKSVELLK